MTEINRNYLKIIIFGLLFTQVLSHKRENENSNKNKCFNSQKERNCITPGCVHAASNVLKCIDPSVDPCDDFYQFACGNYLRQVTIPDEKLMMMRITESNDRVREQLRTIMEEAIHYNDPKPFKLLKTFYKTCMNTTAIENDGLGYAKLILKKLGGWPVTEGAAWDENDFDWKARMYKFRKMGFSINYLIAMGLGEDTRNSSRRMINFDQAHLGLSREYLVQGFNNEVVKAYYAYLVDIAVIYGANRKSALRELRESLNFQIELAKITLPNEQRRNFTALTNIITINELQKKYSFVSWLNYINNLVGISNISISGEEEIDLNVPPYLIDLKRLLERTPKRVQANYLMSRVADSMTSMLTGELRNRQQQFYEVAFGSKKMPQRWKECVVSTTQRMRIAVGALYVRKYFDEDAKRNAEDLILNLKKTLIDMLREVEWMDQITKSKAIEKASAISAHVGYPQELLNDNEIENYYKNLKGSENYLEFSLTCAKFETNNNFKTLREAVNKTDWKRHTSVTAVNAGYDVVENSIFIPAGILQGVFFENDRPNYMNYGGIGFVIGHEITHGFDDRGRQIDKEGILADWWAKETADAFLGKAQCMIEQYGNFTEPTLKMNLNGINTQGENIADNGGIKEAYLAYQSWVQRNGEELRLPGLNYTPTQMFWISAATMWCSKARPEYLRKLILTDFHSPPYFRVFGTFRNSVQFANDFNCPLGSNMNPVEKCNVW